MGAEFAPGDRVRVVAHGTHALHVRTPAYLRGLVGTVVHDLGSAENPEDNAYYQEPARLQLLRVRFSMKTIWGERCERPDDTLDAEIFAHWLVTEDATHAP